MRKVYARKVWTVTRLGLGGWWSNLARFSTKEEAEAYAAPLDQSQGKVLVWEETTMFND